MRTYAYKGYSTDGQSVRGLVEAWDVKEAREKLTRQGLYAEWVKPAGDSRGWVWRRRHVLFQREARATLYRELSVMLEAGLPLAQALSMQVDSPGSDTHGAAFAAIRDRIREGSPFADAVAAASRKFSSFEQAVIRSGEQSGRLGEVLARLADHLEEQGRIHDRLVSALTYPMIVVLLGGSVALFMLVFMLPWLRELLYENGVALPWITRVLLALGQVSLWLFPVVMLGTIAACERARRRWRSDPAFRVAMDRRSFRLPMVGVFRTMLVNLRFSRTLSMLLRNGTTLMDALLPAAAAAGSEWVADAMTQQRESIRQGESFSRAISLIPPLRDELPAWLRAGEASGDLPSMLDAAADRFQMRWESLLTRSMIWVESGLMIAVGLFVFVLALSILLPILSMNALLQ